MKAPISWLNDFVKIDVSPEVLADKLVSAGFEVEEIIYQANQIKNVVCGQILQIEKHQNSDHLLICQVDVKAEKLQIVTGANNIKVGDIVPVALNGAVLPTGIKISNGELRGVKSLGMFCGGSELLLTEEDYTGASVDGILILTPNTEIGVDINDILGNNDVILDISVTANRPDCNSILGIAREVSAILGSPFKQPYINYTATPERITNMLYLTVEDTELCPHYIAKAVKDVKICSSPKLIRNRLKSVGIKPINNIVDITNYILIEIGQPMHAFDYNNIKGQKIVVRRAYENENLVTLDGAKNTLDNSMLVIADAERGLAVAGIMGGLDSGVTESTNTIIFESAKFARDNVRRTARKLNLHSDSSARFEKGIDYISQSLAVDRALTIIQENQWGTIVSGTLDTNVNAVKQNNIVVSNKKVNDILGIKIPIQKKADILNSLQIKTVINNRNLECQIPAFREDISNANDIAEEIIRMYGYNKIKTTLLENAKQTQGGCDVNCKNTNNLKNILVGQGANEIITYSFITPKAFDMLQLESDDILRNAIKILNPLSEDISIMRTTLVHSMISTLANNIAKNNKSATFFEIAKTFTSKSLPLNDFPIETETLSIGQYGEGKDFFTLKGLVENSCSIFGIDNLKFKRAKLNFMHDGRCAEIYIESCCIGYIGEVYPDVAKNYGVDNRLYVAELNLNNLYNYAIPFRPFVAIPKYPSIVRDLALIVKNTVSADDVISVIKKVTNKTLESVDVFDVYKGSGIPKNNVSLALKLTFRSNERTLKDEEVSKEIEHALRSLNRKYRVKLRK